MPSGFPLCFFGSCFFGSGLALATGFDRVPFPPPTPSERSSSVLRPLCCVTRLLPCLPLYYTITSDFLWLSRLLLTKKAGEGLNHRIDSSPHPLGTPTRLGRHHTEGRKDREQKNEEEQNRTENR